VIDEKGREKRIRKSVAVPELFSWVVLKDVLLGAVCAEADAESSHWRR
jgi:hypothetical protein